MAQRDLGRFFSNPPKGGTSAGVQTDNPMGPLPGASPHCRTYGGGATIREKRIDAELAKMSPEERMKWHQEQFDNRPSPDTGVAAVTSLRDAMESGEASARHNKVASSRAKPDYYDPSAPRETEARNFRRSPFVAQEADDPSRDDAYDAEQRSLGRTDQASAKVAKPVPQLYPNTSQTTRSDGRPQVSMGTADGNVVPTNRDKTFA